jgi:endoglucanase
VLERLEQVIAAASERGLAVVVANLRDPQLMADPPSHRERLLASTQQLAEAIKHHGPSVALEPLSEPQLDLDRVWNRYLSEPCATVRDVDPGRTVIVGPRSYNNARFLAELELPEKESNLILAVHQYWPITFTMQGESWLGQTELGDPTTWLETTWDGTPQQRAELEAGFDAVAAYARAQDRPVFIGEFGTTNNADMPSRVRWTRFNRELAEQHGFAWAAGPTGPASRSTTSTPPLAHRAAPRAHPLDAPIMARRRGRVRCQGRRPRRGPVAPAAPQHPQAQVRAGQGHPKVSE